MATQASWRKRNPEYQSQRRLDAAVDRAGAEPARMPSPLDRLPWDWLKDEIGPQHAEFIAQFGRLLLLPRKDEIPPQIVDTR